MSHLRHLIEAAEEECVKGDRTLAQCFADADNIPQDKAQTKINFLKNGMCSGVVVTPLEVATIIESNGSKAEILAVKIKKRADELAKGSGQDLGVRGGANFEGGE